MKEEGFQGIMRGPQEAQAYARGETVPGLVVHQKAADAAPRTLRCERCGARFGCTAGIGKSCWCSQETFRLPMPLPAGVGPYGDCLCPDCLRFVAAELAEQRE